MSTRSDYVVTLLQKLGDIANEAELDDYVSDDDRFLLVETNPYDGSFFITSHESAEAAAEYHDEQEYNQDWIVEALHDLDTGAVLRPEQRTEFT